MMSTPGPTASRTAPMRSRPIAMARDSSSGPSRRGNGLHLNALKPRRRARATTPAGGARPIAYRARPGRHALGTGYPGESVTIDGRRTSVLASEPKAVHRAEQPYVGIKPTISMDKIGDFAMQVFPEL